VDQVLYLTTPPPPSLPIDPCDCIEALVLATFQSPRTTAAHDPFYDQCQRWTEAAQEFARRHTTAVAAAGGAADGAAAKAGEGEEGSKRGRRKRGQGSGSSHSGSDVADVDAAAMMPPPSRPPRAATATSTHAATAAAGTAAGGGGDSLAVAADIAAQLRRISDPFLVFDDDCLEITDPDGTHI